MSPVLDWSEINQPWVENEDFAEIIEKKVGILDILDKLNIEYINHHNGEFSHKLRCPFPSHASGSERTASMFVCVDKNSFYCFGCNTGGSVVNFIGKMLGTPFHESLKWLAQYAGINSCEDIDCLNIPKKEKRDPNKTLVFQAFRVGVLIREHLKSKKSAQDYNKWQVWADKRFKKIDCYLDTLQDDQWEVLGQYYEKIKLFIDRNK